MPWVKIDDRILTNRKIRAAGSKAFLLYTSSLVYSANNLTDGRIEEPDLPVLASLAWLGPRQLESAVANLVREGLWDKDGDTFHVHDFLDYNPSASETQKRRKSASERREKYEGRKTAEVGSGHAQSQNAPRETGSERRSARVPNASPVPVPVPVPQPEPPQKEVVCLSVNDEEQPADTQTDTILSLITVLGIRDDEATRRSIAKAIERYPDTDAEDVALNHIRWQQQLAEKRSAGDHAAFVHRDQLDGWLSSMARAGAHGLHRRQRPGSHLPPRSHEPDLEQPSGWPVWDRLRDHIRQALGEPAFLAWFAQLRP
ncbi:MAG: hypothetical protein ACRDFS_10270, partial [Chloroflexota bacterium]